MSRKALGKSKVCRGELNEPLRKRTMPELWAEKPWKRREFFMTKLNFQTNFPETEVSVVQEARRHRALLKQNDRATTTTTLANTATGSNLPEVVE